MGPQELAIAKRMLEIMSVIYDYAILKKNDDEGILYRICFL